jgi:hypothetical protein
MTRRRSPWKHWLVIIGATTAGTLCATALDKTQIPNGGVDVTDVQELRGEGTVRVADAQPDRRIEETP